MLDGEIVIQELFLYEAAIGNLTAACKGMEQTFMPRSKASGPLQDATQLASTWLTPDRVAYRAALLTDLSHTASLFRPSATPDIKSLVAAVTGLVQGLNDHLATLKKFSGQLADAQARLKKAIGQLQAEHGSLQSQIASFNKEIVSLQQEVARDRNAMIEALSKAHRDNIIGTVFGIVLSPITAGISITIAGIGLVSMAEAAKRVGTLDSQVADSERRMIGLRDGLDDNEAMLASMSMALVPGGIALGDLDSASRSLGVVTTLWTLFEKEMRGVMGHLVSSSTATLSVGQKNWLGMAGREMLAIPSTVATMR